MIDRLVSSSVRFVVIREQGPAWDRARAMREHDYWLGEVDQDGRPVEQTEPVGADGTYRALIVVEADNERELTELTDDDPWSRHRVLDTHAIYRWDMLVGEIASA